MGENSLLEAVQAIHVTGRFCTAGHLPFVFPRMRLADGEEIAFPLPKSQTRALIAHAEPAPFGKGERTVHDETVRKCWQIDAENLRFGGPEWDAAVAAIVAGVTAALGVEGKVLAEPCKLLLYEKGGFFLPHRDTEKLGQMFGSLVLVLPSPHSGGRLVVRHDGREEAIDFSGHAFHVALAGSFLEETEPGRERLRSTLLGDRSLSHLRTILGPALLEKTLRRRFGHPDSLAPEVREEACAILEAEVTRPLRPYPDWARPVRPDLAEQLKRWGSRYLEVAEFLAHPDREEHRIRAPQVVRSGLESTLRSMALDLDFHTEKRGSPHTLVCRKNRRSYQRALRQRAEDEVLLKRLRETA